MHASAIFDHELNYLVDMYDSHSEFLLCMALLLLAIVNGMFAAS